MPRSRRARETVDRVAEAMNRFMQANRSALRTVSRAESNDRERLFGGMPTSYEVSTLSHRPSDTILTIEVNGLRVIVSGRQGKTEIASRTLNFDNGLEAVQRYQEMIGERLLSSFEVLSCGAVARRVINRLPELQEYFDARDAVRRQETDRRIAGQTRPSAAAMRQQILVALQPPPADDEDPKPAETESVSPGLMAKLGGKRKLLRDE